MLITECVSLLASLPPPLAPGSWPGWVAWIGLGLGMPAVKRAVLWALDDRRAGGWRP